MMAISTTSGQARPSQAGRQAIPCHPLSAFSERTNTLKPAV